MNKFVIDLDDHEGSGIVTRYRYAENGEVEEEMSGVLDGEGPHMLYNVTDTVMNKTPSCKTYDEAAAMSHEHRHGYETFFIDSGKMYVYLDGVRVSVGPGDILQLQPGQQHAMAQQEDVKFRGFFHDLVAFNNAIKNTEILQRWPAAADDPDFFAIAMAGDEIMGQDHIKRERPYYKDVPAETSNAVKNPARPYASFAFEGATAKVIVPRWENGGVCECLCVEMEPGFTVKWSKYPRHRELYYVRSGKVKFTIFDEEVIATKACLVDIPRLAPHSLTAMEKSEVYEPHSQVYWSSFLQDYHSIRMLEPDRLDDPATLAGLKEKFGVQIESISASPRP